MKWSVDPTLPAPFELVTATGLDEGCIRTKKGQAIPIMAMRTFNVTCKLAVGTNQTTVTERTAQVSIQVNAAVAK